VEASPKNSKTMFLTTSYKWMVRIPPIYVYCFTKMSSDFISFSLPRDMGKGLPAGNIEHDITNKTLHEHRKKVGMYITKAKTE